MNAPSPDPATRRETVVLLVDDDPVQRKLSCLRLAEAGYRVEDAANGAEALRKARAIHPDVVMSDVIMPGIDGFVLCRRLREEAELSSVPTILLSAHFNDEADQRLAKHVGASALVARTPDFTAEMAALRATLQQGAPGALLPADAALYEEHLRNSADHLVRMAGQVNRSEQWSRALFTHALDCIAILDAGGVVLEANPRWRDVLGIEPAQMVGRHVREFAAAGQEEHNVEQFRASVDGPSRRAVPLRHASGATVMMEFSGNPIEVDGDRVVIAIGRDITAQVAMEAGLRQSQKMEALGQLTGGIAHDFNNLLAVILGNSSLLLDDLGPHDPRREDVEGIREAAEKAGALTKQLLAFSRRQVLEPTNLDLDQTVGGLEKMLRRIVGEEVDLVVTRARDLGVVRADVGQLGQVLLNLAVNARDAMPSGGRLAIETANVDLDQPRETPMVVVPAARYVTLTVSDTGCGMDSETCRRAFEPFFTTKSKGHGTGLGLATCYGIVQQSGGYITVESEPGRGTAFRIYLPRIEGAIEPERPAPIDEGLRGDETVLVVEDDARVRASVARVLGRYGYRVLLAGNGGEALAVARRADQPIDLVLTDVIIPGMSGPEVAEKILALGGHPRVLYMSGYTDHAILRDGELQAGINFIQKPFAPDALARKLRELLGDGG